MKKELLQQVLEFLPDGAEINDKMLKGFRHQNKNWVKFKCWRCSLGLKPDLFKEKFNTKLRVTDFENSVAYMDKELYNTLKKEYGDVIDELVTPAYYEVKL